MIDRTSGLEQSVTAGRQGRVFWLVEESVSGKSTGLRFLSLLRNVWTKNSWSGHVVIGGENVRYMP